MVPMQKQFIVVNTGLFNSAKHWVVWQHPLVERVAFEINATVFAI